MEFFKGITEYDELRKEFLKLSKIFHPDLNPPEREKEMRAKFQELNNQYEELCKIMKSSDNLKSTFKENTDEYQHKVDEKLMEIVDKLTKLNCIVEIIGIFIWVSETKREDADIYRSLKLIWHGKRKMWYYSPLGNGRYAKNKTFDEIRNTYGSTRLTGKEALRIG